MKADRNILFVPDAKMGGESLLEGRFGARPPTAGRRTYPRVVHEGNRFADPTVPCEVCRACGQPWPCDDPGMVESEGHVLWTPSTQRSTVKDALILRWGGWTIGAGMDWAGRLDPHYRSEAWASARALGAELERLGYGKMVFTDEMGVECTDED